jgi:hypothetical protein
MFDSRERIETILKILEKEIDFENFVQQGVILDHFPLHKNNQETFIKEFDNVKFKLMRRFISGDFYSYFGTINFMKSYYGEKYALEFAFLIHY